MYGLLCAVESLLGLAGGPSRSVITGVGGGGLLAWLELALRRLACCSLVLACARPLFLAPVYEMGIPWLLSSAMLRGPRLALNALGVELPFVAVG
mmetsp:Transcript_35227/g.81579  ORF Transcript_35227/g.81579 Transcript_35227/m.81579 type:complete len:95 (+) Transcript_35227:687-971(+)